MNTKPSQVPEDTHGNSASLRNEDTHATVANLDGKFTLHILVSLVR